MILTLNNIGKVRHAEIEIKGITVIAGENDTGKSTVGKVLYSLFNSLHNLKEEIKKNRIKMIASEIEDIFDEKNHGVVFYPLGVAKDIVENYFSSTKQDIDYTFKENLKKIIQNNINVFNKQKMFSLRIKEKTLDDLAINDEIIKNIIDKINEILNVSENRIAIMILNQKIFAEFKGQINNISIKDDGCITLQIKDKKIEALIRNEKVETLNAMIDLNKQILYLDDPFVLDELDDRSIYSLSHPPYMQRRFGSLTHRDFLKECLAFEKDVSDIERVIEESIADEKISRIMNQVNLACPGDIKSLSRGEWAYSISANTNQNLRIENLSTGLKSFAILKTLIQKGYIEENGTVILDEPESHLHPKWQLVFAELIVLIQKELNMHILINTHSPYFLNAIEVYSLKHGIATKCEYYLAENLESTAEINRVTNETEKIYKILARPMQNLENLGSSYD